MIAFSFLSIISKRMKKKTKTYDQWLEFLEDRMRERTSTNRKVKVVALKYDVYSSKEKSIILEFNTYTHSPETGEKIPSTFSISEGEVESAEAFYLLVEEIFNRWDDEWR